MNPYGRENEVFVIVPNEIRDAINTKLDAEIVKHPNAEKERDALYHQLLAYFNEHGVIPDFSLKPPSEEKHACN